MVLENSRVIELIEQGVSPKLTLAIKKAKKVNMHITGLKMKEFLETLDDYESSAQKVLREKLAKSNRSVFSFILRPTDKIFTAKGGTINYNLPQKTIDFIRNNVNDVADGLNIKRYLKKTVKDQYIIDPNGVLFIDIDANGQLETHVINSDKIHWYFNKGNVVKAIIFAPEKREGKQNEGKLFYRVIDQATDRIYVVDDKKTPYELVADRLDNFFKFTPALILGDQKNPNEDIYESIIADILDDADELLRDISVKTVHKLAHAYPRYWSYEQACTRCEGEGVIHTIKDEVNVTEPCNSCGGDGTKHRTNPSDETVLRTPQEGDPVIAPNVAGYVSPDLETMRFYEESVEKCKNAMFQAMWGTTYEQGGKRETATGRFLDSQPVQDRLRDISDTFANYHKFMLDCYAKVLLRNPKYESSVTYGKRYILEGADDILTKLLEASRENVSDLVTRDMLNRYIEAEYQDDNIELIKRKKLSHIEPFPSMKIADVCAIEGMPDKDKLRKIFYGDWLNELTEAELVLNTEEELRKKFEIYINTKQLKNVEKQNTGSEIPNGREA